MQLLRSLCYDSPCVNSAGIWSNGLGFERVWLLVRGVQVSSIWRDDVGRCLEQTSPSVLYTDIIQPRALAQSFSNSNSHLCLVTIAESSWFKGCYTLKGVKIVCSLHLSISWISIPQQHHIYGLQISAGSQGTHQGWNQECTSLFTPSRYGMRVILCTLFGKQDFHLTATYCVYNLRISCKNIFLLYST